MKMKCTHLYIARHGVRPAQTPAGFPLDDEPYTGPGYDAPLSPLGRQQAEALAEQMEDVSIDVIICSPFHRTIQTVAPLARQLGLPIKLEWGLSEFLKDDWFEGFPLLPTPKERRTQFPEIDETYRSMVMPEYPEDLERLQERLQKTTAALMENHGPTIFIMSHGASSLGIRRALLDGNQAPFHFSSDCGSVSHLTWSDGSWQSVLDGNVDHLTSRGIHVPNP